MGRESRSKTELIKIYRCAGKKVSIFQPWPNRLVRSQISKNPISTWCKSISCKVRIIYLILMEIMKHLDKVGASGGTQMLQIKTKKQTTVCYQLRLLQLKSGLIIRSSIGDTPIKMLRKFGLILGKPPRMWCLMIHSSAPILCSTATRCTLCCHQREDSNLRMSSSLNLSIFQDKTQAKTK